MRFISLGYFCSVASDLEKLGLRTESSPFDWVISEFEGIMLAIENNFVDFLDYDYLYQEKNNRNHYKNMKYKISFFHDFDKYSTLKDQLPLVREKYDRRIKRFYNSISEPTTFIRYIIDEENYEKKPNELIFIENNYEKIIKLIKSFNNENEIIFIANEGVTSQKIHIYNVKKDPGDCVSRNPLYNNNELFKMMDSVDLLDRKLNIDRYLCKEKNKNRFTVKIKRKIKMLSKKAFLKEYVHEHQY